MFKFASLVAVLSSLCLLSPAQAKVKTFVIQDVGVNCSIEQLNCDSINMTAADWSALQNAIYHQVAHQMSLKTFEAQFSAALNEDSVEFSTKNGVTTATITLTAANADDETVGSLP